MLLLLVRYNEGSSKRKSYGTISQRNYSQNTCSQDENLHIMKIKSCTKKLENVKEASMQCEISKIKSRKVKQKVSILEFSALSYNELSVLYGKSNIFELK